jgi:hypothetical protein
VKVALRITPARSPKIRRAAIQDSFCKIRDLIKTNSGLFRGAVIQTNSGKPDKIPEALRSNSRCHRLLSGSIRGEFKHRLLISASAYFSPLKSASASRFRELP